MPIQGKFYPQKELVKILRISKQAVSNIAHRQAWDGPQRGLYWAEFVEPFLEGRGIDPLTLPVVDFEHPEGATLAELEAEYMEVALVEARAVSLNHQTKSIANAPLNYPPS